MNVPSAIVLNSFARSLRCIHCGHVYPLEPLTEGCLECRSPEFAANLWVDYDYAAMRKNLDEDQFSRRGRGLDQFRSLLPIADCSETLSMGEGNTPLVRGDDIAIAKGFKEVWLKDETRNPTLSYKDRLCYVAVGVGRVFNRRVACVASSGNQGAAAAAYARRAGMECVVITNTRPLPVMLAQVLMYGARVFRADGLERWRIMRRCVQAYGWWPISNYTWPIATGNPYGLEGYKTIAYEIWRDLGYRIPDSIIVPVSRGEGLAGIWKGFKDLVELGLAKGLPKMISAEPDAGGPLAYNWRGGRSYRDLQMLEPHKTVAVSIGGGVTSVEAMLAIRDSGGCALTLSDEEMLRARDLLAKRSLVVESSSAAAFAALLRLCEVSPGLAWGTAVVILTGSGLKDAIPAETMHTDPAVDLVTADTFADKFASRFGIYPDQL